MLWKQIYFFSTERVYYIYQCPNPNHDFIWEKNKNLATTVLIVPSGRQSQCGIKLPCRIDQGFTKPRKKMCSDLALF